MSSCRTRASPKSSMPSGIGNLGSLEGGRTAAHGIGETVPHRVVQLEASAGGFDLGKASRSRNPSRRRSASSFIQASAKGATPV